MLELSKLVAARLPSVSVHVFITAPPVGASSGVPSISSLSSSILRVAFHLLPTPPLPLDVSASSTSFEVLVFKSLQLSNPDLLLSLKSISETHSVYAIVADFFCGCASPVARKLDIPFYFFFPSGGGGLALFLHFPILNAGCESSEQDKSKPLHIPGLPLMTSLDLPEPCRDRNNMAYQYLLECSQEMSSSAGVIVNTFYALEHRALDAIKKGECRPGERIPTFCIGPLVSSNNEGNKQSPQMTQSYLNLSNSPRSVLGKIARQALTSRDLSLQVNGVEECRTWLDGQPKGSVVLLCFGSMGMFPEQQLKAIATGLETSGQRFLWVVRNRMTTGAVSLWPEIDLASLLPEGFLERTRGRGMVMNSWAPQLYILRHESAGGFVTHCGWNSVLEAVSAGVPMVAWPLYAEQRLQRVQTTEEIGIALRLEEEGNDGRVSAEELEIKLRMLMEGEEGNVLRERARAVRNAAAEAAATGGSSWAAFEELVESWAR